jgi:hypothetical protein
LWRISADQPAIVAPSWWPVFDNANEPARQTRHDANTVADRLGDLPLALERAAARLTTTLEAVAGFRINSTRTGSGGRTNCARLGLGCSMDPANRTVRVHLLGKL